MAHAFRDLQFHGIVIRPSIVEHSSDIAEVRVDDATGANRIWVEIAGRSERRKNHVRVIRTEGLVHSTRTHVSNHAVQRRSELLLNVKIILHDISTLGVRIDVRCSKTIGRQKRSDALVERPGWRVDAAQLKERSGQAREDGVLIKQREDIKLPKTAAHRRLAIVEYIPRESNARVKVSKRRVLEIRAAEVRGCGREGRQVREFAVRFGRHSRHFISHADVQGQMRADPPVILNVTSHNTLAEVARRERTSQTGVEGLGKVLKKRTIYEIPA